MEGADARTFRLDSESLGRRPGGFFGADCNSRLVRFIVRASYAGLTNNEAEDMIHEDHEQLLALVWPTPSINIEPFDDEVGLTVLNDETGHVLVEYSLELGYLKADS